MNMITQKLRNAVGAGNCKGTINDTEVFDASLVELSEHTFPPPHGEAHMLFARHRKPDPEYTTKELTLSLSKGLENTSYDLNPESHQVRLTFVDNSNPEKAVVYTQISGTAELEYDDVSGIFSGTLKKAVVVNRDDDDLKQLTLDVDFSAKGAIGYRTLAA
ncbi:RHS repeat protein [Pseudomonas sp. BGI-2]|uniref:RHS repeat protein n=1 Tax=Pseudomonas sp. BGI-2 TaxID=2528211 RepID=UPI0010354A5E|nr:RHS repeat protein [Pseudomonas sp. BGI-2]TBN38915.1 RHS repeat protein [Pseudomonas sp. BGI-2]